MSALGTPNLGAIEEYKRVSERYTFLSEQRDDVQKSKDEILKIIADITAQMEEIFVREIQEIDEAFRQIFVELFGGGKASLSLEDMNDVLNCGIDIRIQPPGKAVSNISLLSGQTEPDPGEDTDPVPSPEPEAEPKPEPGEEAAPQDEQPQEKEAEAHEE